MAGFQTITATLRKAEADLEKQLGKVRAAIAALDSGRGAQRGRPNGSGKRRRRKLSAAARKAMSDAQKKRWAKKNAGK